MSGHWVHRLVGALLTASALLTALFFAGPAQAAPVAEAWTMIRLAQIDYGCTIGITGRDRTGRAVAITAQHCAPKKALGTPAFLGMQPIQVGRIVADSPLDLLDFASVRLNPGYAAPLSQISSPGHVGDRVCKTGRISGVTCGRIVAITSTSIIVDGARVVLGDSGGPLRNAAGETIGLTSRADLSALPAEPLAAQATFLASMAGLHAPVRTIFTRADKIASQLARSIGFHTRSKVHQS